MKLEQIAASIAADVREPALDVCLRLVNELAKRPPDQLQRLSYIFLAKLVNTKVEDNDFRTALHTLVNHRHHPLTLYYVFLDEGDGREIPLSMRDVKEALDDNEFVHPRTGELVPQYQKLIRPVFKASEEFAEALSNDGR